MNSSLQAGGLPPSLSPSLPAGSAAHTQQTDRTSGGALEEKATRSGRSAAWLDGALAVLMLVVVMSLWTWVIVQMVKTWSEPLHQMRDQLVARSARS
jgi:hypothetical protein